MAKQHEPKHSVCVSCGKANDRPWLRQCSTCAKTQLKALSSVPKAKRFPSHLQHQGEQTR